MEIHLIRARVDEAELLWKMQVASFMSLYEKYQDTDFRNRGYAQQAIIEAEKLHGERNWSLDTILQEKGNCVLYEKMGYVSTGKTDKINDKLTLVYYEK